MSALVVRNVTRDAVYLGDELLLPNATLELNPISDLLHNDELSDRLRLLIGDGVLRVDPDPPETYH